LPILLENIQTFLLKLDRISLKAMLQCGLPISTLEEMHKNQAPQSQNISQLLKFKASLNEQSLKYCRLRKNLALAPWQCAWPRNQGKPCK
jgi:hypothetical protein